MQLKLTPASRRRSSTFLFCLWIFAQNVSAQSQAEIVFQNETCTLAIDLYGGAIIDFRLKDIDCNPFTWKLTPNEMPENNKKGAPFKGHFLCLGRWGEPTEGEIKSGVPHNGQSSNEEWTVLSMEGKTNAVLQSIAPLDYTVLNRSVVLDKSNPVFKVTDKVTSTATVGRLFPTSTLFLSFQKLNH